EVIGVIPEVIVDKEVAHAGLSDLRIVGSMHERKALMAELSDGFVALPGGLGTIEELFEIVTWAQLGIHRKPCGLLNICQYYDKLAEFINHAVSQRFVKEVTRSMLIVEDNPEKLIDGFESYRAPEVKRWIELENT
ncbi:MAG: TIGR00730 family Rossman fold protein, partial [Deltaproteobacteria bacterium]|nr:TIGR00730 family Rossman fold protein [Deltaproteobacteria bacterium]